MIYNVDGIIMNLVICPECGAGKVEGKKCVCQKETVVEEEEQV